MKQYSSDTTAKKNKVAKEGKKQTHAACWVSDSYNTVQKRAESQIVEKKSRFIGYVKPLTDEADAIQFIEEIRSRHWDATHNVYAYCVSGSEIDTKNQNIIQRYSDDGEPSGTAGIPVLDVIKGFGLRNVCIVITRYFGGTLLGAGGLVRAYGKCAKEAVQAAGIALMSLYNVIEIEVEYNLSGRVKYLLEKEGCETENAKYLDKVYITTYVEISATDEFIIKLTESTNGNIVISQTGQQYRSKLLNNL